MILKRPEILPGANALVVSRETRNDVIDNEAVDVRNASAGEYRAAQQLRFIAGHKGNDLSYIVWRGEFR